MATALTDPKQKQKHDRKWLAILFMLLLDDTDDTLSNSVSSYLSGSISAWGMADILATTLTGAHTHAAYLGRRLAGQKRPYGPSDVAFGQSSMLGQTRYLQGLISDLRNDRYKLDNDGDLSPGLAARIRLYVRRLRGTSGEAWLYALPPDTLIYWRMAGNENHCKTCPDREANGPYLAGRMLWVPGDGQSECLGNCLCYLETATGERCFEVP